VQNGAGKNTTRKVINRLQPATKSQHKQHGRIKDERFHVQARFGATVVSCLLMGRQIYFGRERGWNRIAMGLDVAHMSCSQP